MSDGDARCGGVSAEKNISLQVCLFVPGRRRGHSCLSSGACLGQGGSNDCPFPVENGRIRVQTLGFEMRQLVLCLGFQLCCVLLFGATDSLLMGAIARQSLICQGLGPGIPSCTVSTHGFHGNAVDRAGQGAQITSRTEGFDHRVHALVGPYDGIRRTGLDAQGAADAPLLVDHGYGHGPLCTIGRINTLRDGARLQRLAQGKSDAVHALDASRSTPIKASLSCRQRMGISLAVLEAAALTLGLRQDGVNFLGSGTERHDEAMSKPVGIAQAVFCRREG